jgi:hypothetical protein
MSTSLDDCDDFIIPRRQKQENDNYLAIITIVTHYAKQIFAKCNSKLEFEVWSGGESGQY